MKSVNLVPLIVIIYSLMHVVVIFLSFIPSNLPVINTSTYMSCSVNFLTRQHLWVFSCKSFVNC